MTSFHEEFRFGSARWASPEDIARAGLHGSFGPFLGYVGDRPLRLPGDAPIITFGGAGSGKLRDVLAYNMPAIEAAGYEIVLSVHDELLTETPDSPGFTADELGRMMATAPSWAAGLPLAEAKKAGAVLTYG